MPILSKQLHEGGIAVPDHQGGGRKGCGSVLCSHLKPVLPGSQNKQQMVPHHRSEQAKPVPQIGNARNNQALPLAGGVGYILAFQQCLLPHPINPRSRKYLRFHLNSQTFQFMVLPFGLAMTSLEFLKEVKLIAQARGIKIHQYLYDWLLQAPCQETCLQHTQTLLDLCQNLGWVVNLKESELVPQQEFNFVDYHFNLSRGLVKPTQERWQALTFNIRNLMSKDGCFAPQFMSFIGLLTATEKQVVSGHFHMRPIQYHLKNHWHFPESWTRGYLFLVDPFIPTFSGG